MFSGKMCLKKLDKNILLFYAANLTDIFDISIDSLSFENDNSPKKLIIKDVSIIKPEHVQYYGFDITKNIIELHINGINLYLNKQFNTKQIRAPNASHILQTVLNDAVHMFKDYIVDVEELIMPKKGHIFLNAIPYCYIVNAKTPFIFIENRKYSIVNEFKTVLSKLDKLASQNIIHIFEVPRTALYDETYIVLNTKNQPYVIKLTENDNTIPLKNIFEYVPALNYFYDKFFNVLNKSAYVNIVYKPQHPSQYPMHFWFRKDTIVYILFMNYYLSNYYIFTLRTLSEFYHRKFISIDNFNNIIDSFEIAM